MDVTIPINEGDDLCELMFDHKEKLPDSFYLKIMDLLKVYHSGSQNENEIYSELVNNIDKVDSSTMKLIMNKFLPMVKREREREIVVTHQSRPMWPSYVASFLIVILVVRQVNMCMT
jgi:hypothetical protein